MADLQDCTYSRWAQIPGRVPGQLGAGLVAPGGGHGQFPGGHGFGGHHGGGRGGHRGGHALVHYSGGHFVLVRGNGHGSRGGHAVRGRGRGSRGGHSVRSRGRGSRGGHSVRGRGRGSRRRSTRGGHRTPGVSAKKEAKEGARRLKKQRTTAQDELAAELLMGMARMDAAASDSEDISGSDSDMT